MARTLAGARQVASGRRLVTGRGSVPSSAPSNPDPVELPPLPNPTVISGITASNLTSSGVTLTWQLDQPSQGWIEYSTSDGGPYTSETQHELSYTYTTHVQSITGIAPSTTVYYKIVAVNAAGQTSRSSQGSFTTTAVVNPVIASMYANILGMGIAADAKQDQRIGGSQHAEVDYRFISRGGTITGMVIQHRTGPVYSLGDGGIWRVRLYADSAGFRGSLIATLLTNYAPGNPAADARYPLLTFSSTPTLTAGTTYHIVYDNTHADPVNNYSSHNTLWQASPVQTPPGLNGRRFAAFTDDFAFIVRANGVDSVKPWLPNFDLRYSDGGHDGSGYIASFPDSTRTAVISGTSLARERITVPADITLSALYARISRSTGATGNAVISLINGWTSGTLIEALTIDGSSLPEYTVGVANKHGSFIGGSFSQNRALTAGQQVEVRIAKSGGSGSFYMVPALCGPGAPNASNMQSRSFTGGMAQRSTNGGSTWSDLYSVSRTNLEIYGVGV